MTYIDSHIHLDSKSRHSAADQVLDISTRMQHLGIDLGVLIHLNWQTYSVEEIATSVGKVKNLVSFINLNPKESDAQKKLTYSVSELNVKGLKLHPRFETFDIFCKETIELCRTAGSLKIPVLICSFPDRLFLQNQLTPLQYFELARSCPDTNFIWGHMGGHKVLDFMMLARALENVYMDFSLSLLYYKDSSVVSDMVYAFKNMKFQRIFYGSDYPDRSLEASLQETLQVLNSYNLKDSQINRLLFQNAHELLGRT